MSAIRYGEAAKKFTPRPLLFHHPATDTTPERISLQFGRRYFVGFGNLPRNPEIPPITEAQAEALDALHYLSEKFCVNTHFAKGDIQYINNVAITHSRDGFLDDNENRYVLISRLSCLIPSLATHNFSCHPPVTDRYPDDTSFGSGCEIRSTLGRFRKSSSGGGISSTVE